MKSTNAQTIIADIIKPAGITLNGHAPWDLQIHHKDFYTRVLKEGSLGLGESYMDKWWDCERLDLFFDKVLWANLYDKVTVPFSYKLKIALSQIFNYQTKTRAKEVAVKHYNLGNDLFNAMLDERMIYSCGYWKDAKTLDEAQVAKLDLICQKLQLSPGMHVLDIGCGWGGLARYAAEKYGVSVVGLTISKDQCDYAQQNCQGLPVEIQLKDYRDATGSYDRIVSVGMFEHVGNKNYLEYMQIAHRLLKEEGLFLLHTIGIDETALFVNEWTTKYIFPNGMLPSIAQVGKAAEKLFHMEDWQNFGTYYDKTLMAWHDNFVRHWGELQPTYGERFYRMWTYYLLSCAGSFRARNNQVWQIVFSKNRPGIYIGPR